MAVGELARQCVRHLVSPKRVPKPSAAMQTTLRAALITDLFLSGRIVEDPDGAWVVQTGRSGDAATDVLLAYLDEQPGRTLDDITDSGPAVYDSVVAGLVSSGTWRLEGGHFEDVAASSLLLPGKNQAYRIVTADQPADAFESSLAVLLYPWRSTPGGVIDRCGPASEYLISYLGRHGIERIRGIDLLDRFVGY